jgi:alpha-glucosidase
VSGVRHTWWRDRVLYQIYSRSFADANGDGIGDLDGITSRLPYLVRLGVGAVWLSPIYPSGGADGGYDVADYLDVDPVYGGMEAFDRFLATAHGLGLKVVMDFVPNHTSDRHPWFEEAAASRDSDRRDWYVWADARDLTRGTGSAGREPPNNWRSGFGGSAWVWHEPSGQFYLASFYAEQPDLNWENPQVRDAMTGAMRFWVDRGVDGFRLDVIHKLGKDPALRDNPDDPRVRFDENQPQVHDHVRAIREAVGSETFLLGEVWVLDLVEVHRFLAPGELDAAFNFAFATSPWNPKAMASAILAAEELLAASAGETWPTYHLSNHDEPRLATRYGHRAVRPAAVLLLTLRGTTVLYQGEEIGMENGNVAPDRRHDRAGRDPQRTPMQWNGDQNAGFCPPGVVPWLPVANDAAAWNVATQEGQADSVLSLYRRLLRLREGFEALRAGDFRMLAVDDRVIAYEREGSDGRLVVACNFTSQPAEVPLPSQGGTVVVGSSAAREGSPTGSLIRLGADEAVVVRVR